MPRRGVSRKPRTTRQRFFSKGLIMATYTHQTAPTQFIKANGIQFAYRRFGKPGGPPLVFNMHFTGTMDHWDPAVTDGLAHHGSQYQYPERFVQHASLLLSEQDAR